VEDETLGAAFKELPIPEDLLLEAKMHREMLVETLADKDDGVMNKYLAEEEIELSELKRAIRAATVNLKLVPILAGRPSETRHPAASRRDHRLSPPPRTSRPLLGRFLGLPSSTPGLPQSKAPFPPLLSRCKWTREKADLCPHLLRDGQGRRYDFQPGAKGQGKARQASEMHANKRERIEEASAGDILAVMGLKVSTTGDTLCTEDHPILLEPMSFNAPVSPWRSSPKAFRTRTSSLDALAKLSDEDPTFKYRIDDETGQTVISGMGELHLEIIVNRLRREFVVDTNQGKPRWCTGKRSPRGWSTRRSFRENWQASSTLPA